jgi:hypothetical protein
MTAEKNKTLQAAVLLLKALSLEKKLVSHLAVTMEIQEGAVPANC